MSNNQHPRFSLIGGGLAGALLATYIGRAGYDVDLYERRTDPQAGNYVGGRSINLAISTRGIAALEELGLADEVMQHAVPMRGRMIHDRGGGRHYQPYDKDPARHINSLGRGTLNSITLAAARRMPNVRVFFNHRCTDVELEKPTAHLLTGDGQTVQSSGDIVIGVDGAYSAVRRSMQKLERFNYSQDYLAHGYKELTIPPRDGGGYRMEPNALHIWPRRSFMMIALPNIDGSFTCTLFFPFDGPLSFATLKNEDDVRRFFAEQFPDAAPLMPTLLEDYRQNPVGSMMTVRCGPWNVGGRVTLVGDAAHAIVPFYGQGMNAGFEDCIVFNACMREFAPDWPRVFDEYYRRRKIHTDTVADLALNNFIEMRDKTASRTFRAYKKFDRTMHRLLPGWYTPLYTMVSFTRIPYAEAVARARRQDRAALVAGILALLAILALITWVLTLSLNAEANPVGHDFFFGVQRCDFSAFARIPARWRSGL